MRNAMILLVCFSAIAYADYAAGLRSYRAGDYATAEAQWRPLAEQGDAKSEAGMASLYYNGNGHPKDYGQALTWFRRAADHGLASAQSMVGSFYYSGLVVQKDYTEAARWFQKAADQGYIRAQNYVGFRYLRGEGVAQDYLKAEMWFALSGPGTDQEDADARAEVLRHLTPEQITDALRLAQEWRANRSATQAAPTTSAAKPPTLQSSVTRAVPPPPIGFDFDSPPAESPRTPKSVKPAASIRTTPQGTLTTAEIAKLVSRSVVVIQGKTASGEVLGSGFIVSRDGKIVTNLHVIRDLKTASVQLSNGQMFNSVSVLATDEQLDLGIIQVPGFDLPVLDLGDSDSVAVGEPLVIVGSPRGLEGSVTAGILSSVRDTGDGFKVLQTDAAVNPGNSGGPLLNNRGQAIGVVSFKLLSSEGLNFAIPVNYVRGLLSSLHGPLTLDQMRLTLNATKTILGACPRIHPGQGISLAF